MHEGADENQDFFSWPKLPVSSDSKSDSDLYNDTNIIKFSGPNNGVIKSHWNGYSEFTYWHQIGTPIHLSALKDSISCVAQTASSKTTEQDNKFIDVDNNLSKIKVDFQS